MLAQFRTIMACILCTPIVVLYSSIVSPSWWKPQWSCGWLSLRPYQIFVSELTANKKAPVTFVLQCDRPGWPSVTHIAWSLVNTLRLRQNGRGFPDDIFRCIFLNENVQISIKISLRFVPKSPINNIPALVQIMAWHQTGYRPLSEAIMA